MKKNIFLLVIIFVASFLRLWNLGAYPALNADEAAIGYNAYSLLETGKDEHSNSWPIHFQSFNDYKPGLYVYLVVPLVKFLGLNAWSVRLPSAVLGIVTIYLVYLLARQLVEKEKLIYVFKKKVHFAHIAALMIAISPWHIHYSRGGWEVNVSTFLILTGVYLFIRHRNKLPILMISALFFALSLYTYHAVRVIVPMLGVGLLIMFINDIKKYWKNYSIALLFFIVCITPLAQELVKPEIISRSAGVGLFADIGPLSRVNEQRGEHSDFTSSPAKIMHNKVVNYSLAFFENWLEHYHGEFLFVSGDMIQRNKVPETGQLYIFELLTIVIGLVYLIKKPLRNWKIILYWLFVAPAAAALTFQSPHALRAQNMVIPLSLVSSYGMYRVFALISSKKVSIVILKMAKCMLALLIVWSMFRYQHMYWVHMTKEYPFSSQYGVKELAEYIQKNSKEYENIVITTKYDQPYILLLFYLKYSPEDFQNDHTLTPRDKYGFSTVSDFDKYIFKDIQWDKDRLDYPNSIIAGTGEEIPEETNIVRTIKGRNDYEYFKVVAN